MPLIQISFTEPLNVSIQATDTLYQAELVPANTNSPWSNYGQAGTNQPNFTGVNTRPEAIGEVQSVDFNNNTVTIQTDGFQNPALTTIDTKKYLFFSKDKGINTSGITGYYAETEYRNSSRDYAEMFATAIDYAESSK
tara:strand:+ start:1434 stop:1847 length:414 start_codon:yes stop_codon:yes gene_type:complete